MEFWSVLFFVAGAFAAPADEETDLEKHLTGCLPLDSACVPGNPLSRQQCCADQGHACMPRTLLQGQFSCQKDSIRGCLNMNAQCDPDAILPGKQCCESEGLTCQPNPYYPLKHYCAQGPGQCIALGQPCVANGLSNCCTNLGLKCIRNTCQFDREAGSCLPSNSPCTLTGKRCCDSSCRAGTNGERRCPRS